jgi:bacterioferritin-associated ferredoxin
MYVCVCKAVTDSQILTAIEQGACTRKQLTHCFGVGKDCGKCNKDVITLLAQTKATFQPLPCSSNQAIADTTNNHLVIRQDGSKPSRAVCPDWQTANKLTHPPLILRN